MDNWDKIKTVILLSLVLVQIAVWFGVLISGLRAYRAIKDAESSEEPVKHPDQK